MTVWTQRSNGTWAEEIVMVRCPSCKGLRGMAGRHVERYGVGVCRECRRGNVVPRSHYHNYWTERFSMDEIREMAAALWP